MRFELNSCVRTSRERGQGLLSGVERVGPLATHMVTAAKAGTHAHSMLETGLAKLRDPSSASP